MIAVVDDQISERFVTPTRGVKVVVRFIEQHLRAAFRVSRFRDFRVKIRIGDLLRESHRDAESDQKCRGEARRYEPVHKLIQALGRENPVGMRSL
ncbi:MAG: hypothetical protein DMF74_15340 [Acidobacteria bacterium]|nr:MAG: hypothetical protein DMF74_15340 [Acidobacteriota bacterium]